MASHLSNSASPHHPAAQKGRVSQPHFFVALLGAPAAWVAQMMLSEILSSYACYPHRKPVTVPLFDGLVPALSVISIAAFVAGALFCFIAWRAWRQSRDEIKNAHQVIEVGEGRVKFLSLLSLFSSLLFLIAILFTGCALIMVSPCGA